MILPRSNLLPIYSARVDCKVYLGVGWGPPEPSGNCRSAEVTSFHDNIPSGYRAPRGHQTARVMVWEFMGGSDAQDARKLYSVLSISLIE